VAETIRTDLREEIGFLKVFDAAIRATMDIVDTCLFAGTADPAKQWPAIGDKTRNVFPNLRMRRFLPSKKLWPLSVRMGHRVDVTL
jgi:hypothetical protein